MREWNEEHFEKFYKAIEFFKDQNLGNRKIAEYMKDITKQEVEPSQIRYEKLRYQKLKRMNERREALQRIE